MYQASCASTQNRVNPSYSALRNAAAQNKKRIRSRHQVKKYCGDKKDFIMNNAKNNKHAPSQITKKGLWGCVKTCPQSREKPKWFFTGFFNLRRKNGKLKKENTYEKSR